MVQEEIYDWEIMNHDPLTEEEYFRLSLIEESHGFRSNSIRERSIDRGNMIWRFLYYYDTPDGEYETAVFNSLFEVKEQIE